MLELRNISIAGSLIKFKPVALIILFQPLGYFILATNDCDAANFTASDVLENYKSQQQVERGFRFLKDPAFLVSSLFLKKPERIEAMLMIMTLCLMIYAAIQHRIRYELKKQSKCFTDMKRKAGQNPTARWVFFCFQGVNVLHVGTQERHITEPLSIYWVIHTKKFILKVRW